MKFYLPKRERDDLIELMNSFQKILNDENSSAEEKQIAQLQISKIAGTLGSPLFPVGIIRNVLMVGFIALGFLSFYTPYKWLIWSFLIAVTFSPRIVAEVVHGLGRVIGTLKSLSRTA